MSVSPRLLLGVSCAETVTLEVAGSISSNPKLQVWKPTGTPGEPDLIEYDAGAGRWQVSLTAGIYLLRIDAAETATATALTVSASAAVTFTRFGDEPAVGPVPISRTWVGTSAVGPGVVQDPWPPPGSGNTLEPWLGRAVREHHEEVPKP